jgi:hypothetical protein
MWMFLAYEDLWTYYYANSSPTLDRDEHQWIKSYSHLFNVLLSYFRDNFERMKKII